MKNQLLCVPQDRREKKLQPAIVSVETLAPSQWVNRQSGQETHNYKIKPCTRGTFLVGLVGLIVCLQRGPVRPVQSHEEGQVAANESLQRLHSFQLAVSVFLTCVLHYMIA